VEIQYKMYEKQHSARLPVVVLKDAVLRLVRRKNDKSSIDKRYREAGRLDGRITKIVLVGNPNSRVCSIQ